MSDLSDYRRLIAAKRIAAVPTGIRRTPELSDKLFDYQVACAQFALRTGRSALFLDTGLGKQQPLSEPVLTPAGWSTMGALKVGDFVVGSNGLPTEVLGVYPQGAKPVFRLELSDGTFSRCGSEHLWSVRTKTQRYRGEGFQTLTTAEIAASVHRDWQLPIFDPAATVNVKLPIEPYAFGVALGDACFTKGNVELCSDREIAQSLGWRITRDHDTCAYVAYAAVPVEIVDRLASLGLRSAHSDEKFVPVVYFNASPSQRLALLQGLMDTDGYAMPDGGAEFSSTSRNLIAAVCDLVRSLGGVARGLREAASTFTYNGEHRRGKPAWRVNVKLPPGVPMFRLSRKASAYVSPTKYPCARIVRRVVDEGVSEEQVCIRVAANDSLYVTRDYILTHNTATSLEWARCVVEETNKPVLMLAPLGVVHQHLEEAGKFGIEAKISRTGAPPSTPQIVITNYDRLERFDVSDYGGVVLDESSVLKSFSSVTTKKLTSAFAKTPFRLCCSATPAPNDHTELGTHSEFLGTLPLSQMLVRWFLHDSADTGTWRLKGHAVRDFWDWVASWARCLSRPSDLGFSDAGFEMPPLNVHKHVVEADRSEDAGAEKDGQFRLFRLPDTSATSIHKEKRLTKDKRAAKVAKLLAREPDEPWIIWCDTDYDADALKAIIPNLNEVRGSMSVDVKEDRLTAFATGQAKTLLTKPSIAGYGLNFQHCARMAFMGLSFSYENYYQAIRRCWRFRQKRPVEVHVVCADTEASIWDVVSRKSGDHDRMKIEMSAAMARAHQAAEILGTYNPQQEARLPAFLA